MRRSKRIIIRADVVENIYRFGNESNYVRDLYFFARQSAKNITVKVTDYLGISHFQYLNYTQVGKVSVDCSNEQILYRWLEEWRPALIRAIRADPVFLKIQEAV